MFTQHKLRDYQLDLRRFTHLNQESVVLDVILVDQDFGQSMVRAFLPSHDVFVFLKSDHSLPPYGHLIRVEGVFSLPMVSRNPGQFDFSRYCLTHNSIGIIHVSTFNILDSYLLNPIKRLAFLLKKRLLSLHHTSLSRPYSDLFIGLIFGQHGTQLPFPLVNQYRYVGLIHLLVVSGAQVSLLANCSYRFFSMLAFSPFIIFFILSFFQFIFYFVSGGGVSIFRAIFMTEIVFFFRLFYRRVPPIYVLSFVALFMGLLNPLVYRDIGFQLSFVATASLLYAAPLFQRILPSYFPSFLRYYLSVSLTPTLFTLPLLMYHFYIVSWISFFANFFVVFIVEFLVVYGFFISLGALFFPFILLFLNKLPLVILIGINYLVDVLNSIPYGQFSVGSCSLFFIGLIYLVYFYFFRFSLSSFRLDNLKYYFCGLRNVFSSHHFLFTPLALSLAFLLYSLPFLFFLCFVFVYFLFNYLQPRAFRVVFFDVGQGDSALIMTPNGKNMLIDAGDKAFGFDVGRSVLLPALRYYGINRLDFFILSHADRDHYAGIESVLPRIPVTHFIDYSPSRPKHLRALLHRYSITPTRFSASMFRGGDADLKIDFFPMSSFFTDSRNQGSLLLRVSYKDCSFLFTGDIEEEAEHVLLNLGVHLDSDVIKVPHHGSKTSSSLPFLLATSAPIAVVSCGRLNRFNHPHSEVLHRYKSMESIIYRTDHHGAILFESDGLSIRTRSWLED
ncbi:MAG: DNA internalization-related competence protein ComEC/Rec2 [bacterium]